MTRAQPQLRESALAFTEGVRMGWTCGDLLSWAQVHLLEPQRISIPSGAMRVVREADVGVVALTQAVQSGSTRTTTSAQIPQLLAASRERVVQSLRAAIATGQLGFVHAALYAGRVSRERGPDGTSSWTVWLAEEDQLSDQVLALFAADALIDPQAYETELAACDACGAISFGVASSRRGCPAHPFGSSEREGSAPSGMRASVRGT